jgi:histidinol phosphatase-like enzyme
MLRISLIIAILAALAIGVLNFVMVRDKVTKLAASRDSEKAQKEQAQTELASTKQDLETTSNKLKQTEESLTAATAEAAAAKAEAETQIKRATELADKLAKTTEERDTAQAYLQRYKGTGYEPEQIAALGKQIRDLQLAVEVSAEEKKILQRNLEKTTAELRRLKGEDYVVELPPTAAGKVVVVDPKWEFVVLDFGSDRGAKPYGELLVSRNGRLVAKVVIRGIEKDRCIANVMPGWTFGEVAEGDMVIPAHPES